MQMTLEQKVRLTFHAWAVEPIIEDGVMRGAIFESKEGRQAILAKTVVDSTGDADLMARAGLPFETDSDETDIHSCINTAFMIGGVDMERWLAFRANDKQGFKGFMDRGREKLKFFEKPFVSWRNDVALFMGPRLAGYSAVDVEDLSEIEVRSRQLTVGHVETYRAHAPGFENAFLMLGAPQIGVRHSRRLIGLNKVTGGRSGTGARCGTTRSAFPHPWRPSSRTSRCPTVRWCRWASTACWAPAATSRVTPIPIPFCAKYRNAG